MEKNCASIWLYIKRCLVLIAVDQNRCFCIGSSVGAFTELWKTTVTVVMSVCPPVRPHGTIRLPLDGFSWNSMSVFRKSVEKIQVSFMCNKNVGYLTWRLLCLYICDDIALNYSQNEKCFRQICRENQNTRFVFSNFFFENHAVYGIMWKNFVESDRPKMTVRRMCLHAGYLRLQTRCQNT